MHHSLPEAVDLQDPRLLQRSCIGLIRFLRCQTLSGVEANACFCWLLSFVYKMFVPIAHRVCHVVMHTGPSCKVCHCSAKHYSNGNELMIPGGVYCP